MNFVDFGIPTFKTLALKILYSVCIIKYSISAIHKNFDV